MAVVPAFFAVSLARWSPNILGNAMVGWIFAGQDTGTGWTAYLACGIPACELHALIGNAVDVWGFVKVDPSLVKSMAPRSSTNMNSTLGCLV